MPQNIRRIYEYHDWANHKGLSMNNVCTLLLAPRLAGQARATSMLACMQGASNKAGEPAGRKPAGARRLASVRPALAPKCKRYSLPGPNVLDAASQLAIPEQEAQLGGSFSTFIETLRRLLTVEFLFLRRWQELPPQQEPEWRTMNQIRNSWLSIETQRNQFLLDLNEAMLSKRIHYSDTRGRAVALELWQAIFQYVNHSTFHRGQLIEKLRKLGKMPPTTDFVLFCRGTDE